MILTYILGLPFLAAVGLLFVPRNFRVVMRGVAVLATGLSAVLALAMFVQFRAGATGYQFVQ